jgi:dienelactone hydrolase
MADIVLFHSVLGPRAGVTDAADRLRAAGHTVNTPDLYRGAARFDTYDPAMAYQESAGFQELLRRAAADVAPLPSKLVYMGFSAGGVSGEWLAATRPDALACILLHAALPLRAMRLDAWPAAVPAQLPFMRDDPFRDQVEVMRCRSSAGDVAQRTRTTLVSAKAVERLSQRSSHRTNLSRRPPGRATASHRSCRGPLPPASVDVRLRAVYPQRSWQAWLLPSWRFSSRVE